MTLLQAVLIIVGVGFALAFIRAVVAWNSIAGPKPTIAEMAGPFSVKWALYSGGVALALGIQYLLTTMRS